MTRERHSVLCRLATAAAICAVLFLCDRTFAAKQFRAGAYAVDITPQQFPVIVNGGMLERTTSNVVDPLHARCLVLDDGDSQIAFAIVDSCVIPREIIDEAKQLAGRATGIPTAHMLISATHCHSAPSVFAVLGSGRQEDYVKWLPGRIAEGLVAAWKNLAPARIGWAVGEDPTNVFCRRFRMAPGKARSIGFTGKMNDQAQMNPGYENPDAIERTGPADTSLPVIAVQSPDGKPIALLANYSTHYAGAPALSADYFGVFAHRIEELIGAKDDASFVAMMTNGSSGDANCCDFVHPKREYTYKTVGEDTARAALQAYRRIQYHDWAPLAAAERLLTLDIRMPTAAEVAEAKEFLSKLEGDTPKTIEQVYARETILLSQTPPTRELKLQAMRIGGLGITAIPCEVYGSTGLEIKAKSPLKPTVNIELANGYYGYIPPPDQHKLGGYTTWRARSSCLEEEAEPKIKAAILELLDEVAQSRADEKAVPAK